MLMIDPATHISWDMIQSLFHTSWLIPVGIVVIYYYGNRHFNSLDYSLEASGSSIPNFNLLTAAPPNFTTTRSKYNFYANLYILILIAIFLSMVFFYDLLIHVADFLNFKLPPNPGTIELRAAVALCAVTGLLSSFPGLKEIDGWILGELHRMALIPDDARQLAKQLSAAAFQPSKEAETAAMAALTKRDTIRVAEGKASGSLEKRIFELLCLRAQIRIMEANCRYQVFSMKLRRDIEGVHGHVQVLDGELKNYLKDQERLVPSDVDNIDTYIATNLHLPDVNELSERRTTIKAKCEALYDLMCLIIALSVLATEPTPEDMNEAIGRTGFNLVLPPAARSLDWNAIAMVTLSTFVLLLLFNKIYLVVGARFDFAKIPGLMPDRSAFFRFTFAYTFGYALIMFLVIRLKRKWRRESPTEKRRPEEILTALYAYAATLPINEVIGYSIRHQITYAPLLYALNQAVVGCFIGIYVDRARILKLSIALPVIQGLLQAATALIAVFYSPPREGFQPNGSFDMFMGTFSAFQAASSGLLIGLLFQYFYGQYIGGRLPTTADLERPAEPDRNASRPAAA